MSEHFISSALMLPVFGSSAAHLLCMFIKMERFIRHVLQLCCSQSTVCLVFLSFLK